MERPNNSPSGRGAHARRASLKFLRSLRKSSSSRETNPLTFLIVGGWQMVFAVRCANASYTERTISHTLPLHLCLSPCTNESPRRNLLSYLFARHIPNTFCASYSQSFSADCKTMFATALK